jgi:hypothetical protein
MLYLPGGIDKNYGTRQSTYEEQFACSLLSQSCSEVKDLWPGTATSGGRTLAVIYCGTALRSAGQIHGVDTTPAARSLKRDLHDWAKKLKLIMWVVTA